MYYLKLILIFIVFFNTSCSQTIQSQGVSNIKINEIKIEPGKTSKKNLINRYGPPIFESIFNNNIIYYISHVTGYKNLENRETIDLVVFEIKLDKNNIVQKDTKYNEDDASNIKVSDKRTLNNNNKSIMFWKDILNNLSRRNLEN